MRSLLSVVVVVLFSISLPSYAESSIETGSGLLTSTANVYFMIKIPSTMYVRIGTDDFLKLNTNNNGSASTSSAGQLTAHVVGNSGTAVLSASNSRYLDVRDATNIKLFKNLETRISNKELISVTYTAAMP